MAKQSRCDVCGRVAALGAFDGLPAGWLEFTERIAGKYGTVTAGPAAQVCGLGCLETFARQELNARARAEAEAQEGRALAAAAADRAQLEAARFAADQDAIGDVAAPVVPAGWVPGDGLRLHLGGKDERGAARVGALLGGLVAVYLAGWLWVGLRMPTFYGW